MNAQTEEWSLRISIILQDTLLVGALSDELIKEYFWIEQKKNGLVGGRCGSPEVSRQMSKSRGKR